MAASADDEATRKLALDALPDVCRTGTHLFAFARYVEQFRGWGRGAAPRRRRVVRRRQAPDQLAYQAVKYRQRDGVSHRDVLRLAHPGAKTRAGNPRLPVTDEHARLFEWIVRRRDGCARRWPARGARRAVRARRPHAAVRAGAGGDVGGRDGAPDPRVRPAARGGQARAPRRRRGVGGAARADADDGAAAQPGDADPRRAWSRPGSHGDGARRSSSSATRSGCARARAPDRGAVGAAHVRERPRRPRARTRGRRWRRWSTRSTPRSTRRSGTSSRRTAHAARARRVGLDGLRRDGRCAGPDAAGRVGGDGAGDRGHRAAPRVRRASRGTGGWTRGRSTRAHAAGDQPAPAAGRRGARPSPACRSAARTARCRCCTRSSQREVDTFVIYTDTETWAGQVHPVQALRRVPGADRDRRAAGRGRHGRRTGSRSPTPRTRGCWTSSGSTPRRRRWSPASRAGRCDGRGACEAPLSSFWLDERSGR